MMSWHKQLLFLVTSSLLLLQAPHAVGDDGDVFNIDTALGVTRDDNLYRLAPSVDPHTLGLAGKGDTITSALVGLDFKKPVGPQLFLGNVSVVNTRYQDNKYLNFTALNYDAKWQWSVGPRWNGEVAVDRAEALNSYADYNTVGIRNKRTTENESFTMSYWYHSDWAVLAGVSRNQLTNEQTFLEDGDYAANGYNVGLRYRPRSGNTITLRAKRSNAKYSNRPFNPVLQFDNGFTQNGYEATLDWQLSGVSKLRGRLEHIDRQHDNFGARDYSGLTGNLDFVFAYGAGLVTSVGYKRSIETYQAATSSYYTADEPNVSVKWTASDKIDVSLRVGFGQRSYHGEIAPLPPGVSQREDRFTRGNFDISYRPIRSLEIKLGVGQDNRNVNNNALDYKDRIVYTAATLRF